MINRYLALFGGLGVLLGVYALWWQNEAERLETAFPQALAKSLPPGAALRQKVAEVDGFPFRLNVRLADVKVSWGEDEWVSTPSITGVFQPFTGDHLLLHMDAPISFSLGRRRSANERPPQPARYRKERGRCSRISTGSKPCARAR